MLLRDRINIIFSWQKKRDLDGLALTLKTNFDLEIPGLHLGIRLKRKAEHQTFVSKDAQRDDSENRA